MAKRKRLGPAGAFSAELSAPPATTSALPPIAAVSGDASATSALAELSHVLDSARSEGRLVQKIPLTDIKADHLVRDRLVNDADDMTALIDSIRARGQQTPIEVVALGENAHGTPQYGLVSGWRRLRALRSLADHGGHAATALARVIAPHSQTDSYMAMVEENEIRANLSYYERAHIVARAVEAGVYDTPKAALNGLFANVSRAKRSKIKSFVDVVMALDAHLRFPAAIGERLGLQLSKAVTEGRAPDFVAALAAEFDTAEDEQSALRTALAGAKKPAPEATGSTPRWPGVDMVQDGNRIHLQGPGLTPTFLRALQDWINQADN